MSIEKAPKPEVSKTTEIERKFVIHPDVLEDALQRGHPLEAYPHKKIAQGYLASTPECAVRVRRKGEQFFLTYKAAPAAHAAERVELETELTSDQFETMWPGTEGRRVEKTRYEIPAGNHMIELDIFEGEHAGHIIAEVEFGSTAEADEFPVPMWFGADVTADKAYGNASIAEHGFPESY